MNSTLDSIKTILTNRKEKIAVAESVTAGDIQAALSLSENALQFFEGGITVYNLQQKVKHLHINAENAKTCNCVSEQTAVEMAIGVSSLFDVDWGISITGYASAVPEQGVEDLFAWVAFADRSKPVFTAKINAAPGTPADVRSYYKEKTLAMFLDVLSRARTN